jgi:hypothetical protein
VSIVTVTTAAGTSLIKPQGHAAGQPVVAKVVSNAQGQVISMESLLAHHKQQTITQQGRLHLIFIFSGYKFYSCLNEY